MKIILRPFLIWAPLILFLFACTSPKQILYFQDLKSSLPDTINKRVDYRIQPNDFLQITVASINTEADLPFTKSEIRIERNGSYLSGYMVDSAGYIGLPYIGNIKLSGMTLYEAKKTIAEKLSPFLKDYVVNMRMANYTVSILGEVNRSGTYTFPDELVTVPQALSMAGDLTIYAKRDSILVIREVNGVRSYAKFDLRTEDILKSPYYYLQNKDIIYVPPAKSKIAQADTRRWQVLFVIASVLSLTTVIITSFN